MKKTYIKVLIVLICIAIAVCILKAVASATDEIPTPVETEAVVTETLPIEEEGEISATEEPPVLTTEMIVEWIYENYEEITVILAVVSAALLIVHRLTLVIKSITTCNNNAVTIAEDTSEAMKTNNLHIENIAGIVGTYKEEIANALAEIRQSAEEKKKLETALTEVENYLKTAKLANTELANEVAELLVLANIPNSKKEELYARHRAAVAAIDAADHKNTEVKEDVGEEA